ncbi:MAG TPA: TIGR02647 family protein [Cellvibrio sp.]|uniref:TIGR02647 family protein n=1 Tax=Cellvibrio sp. TaxID=1965322 RepID=UPI000ED652A5|nr:TIGR02647 family protein [Cellvibrio sp.]HCS66507.1 TIGR02647 family protein [Cellvibrio sp.]
MPISPELAAEMQVLRMFDTSTSQSGLKVHSDASPDVIAATRSLFEKQLTTQIDGGYLTPLGYECSVHLQQVIQILNSKPLL